LGYAVLRGTPGEEAEKPPTVSGERLRSARAQYA
jgi:hypothetical protein